ncbi:unnamed protein product [Brassica oleracea]
MFFSLVLHLHFRTIATARKSVKVFSLPAYSSRVVTTVTPKRRLCMVQD